MNESHRHVLMIETHRLVRDAARQALAKLDGCAATIELNYPPEPVIASGEAEALLAADLSGPARTALEKVVADACAAALFHFLCLIDRVADAEVTSLESWLGMEIVEPHTDDYREMLHDVFYDSYWVFKERGRAA